jgi:hypothetical protein
LTCRRFGRRRDGSDSQLTVVLCVGVGSGRGSLGVGSSHRPGWDGITGRWSGCGRGLGCFRRLQVWWDRDSGRWFALVLLACGLLCCNRLEPAQGNDASAAYARLVRICSSLARIRFCTYAPSGRLPVPTSIDSGTEESAPVLAKGDGAAGWARQPHRVWRGCDRVRPRAPAASCGSPVARPTRPAPRPAPERRRARRG